MSGSPPQLFRGTKMAPQFSVNDSEWDEVKYINGYALFMGYLMMGVRGLGLLVITWTTVVLLGGFVSDLEKKDFWCLTGITLIQTAGVFNFLLTEKLSHMVHLWWGLLGAAVGTFSKGKRKAKAKEDDQDDDDDDEGIDFVSSGRFFLAVGASTIQGVVLFVILCPVSILYVFGLYISTGASLWRLIKQDFGNEGGANMKPALRVLYSLAVGQGALFVYKKLHGFLAKAGLVEYVYHELSKEVDEELVAEYLKETVAGCEKDPSFATGRNLITYGVGLMMEAKSNEGFIAGVKVVGGVTGYGFSGRKVLAKYLLTRSDSSSSSSAIIQRLLETAGPRSPYSKEIKVRVVTILDIIAPCIRLEQFPRAIECLCSVADRSEEPSNELQEGEDSDEWMRKIKDYEFSQKFKDYERADLLEKYQKDYLQRESEQSFASPDCDCSFLSTLQQCLNQLIQHCFPCKRKKVGKKTEEGITVTFDWMLLTATDIIHSLVAQEDNRWILRACVSNTVLHKIARLPIKLRRESHVPIYGLHQRLLHQFQMIEKCQELTEWLLVALTETSSPHLLPAPTPAGEGRQRRRIEEIEEEVQEVEEQLILLRFMGGSALRSTIKRTIKHSIESTIKCILDCPDCPAGDKMHAIQFLLHLSLDMSTIIKDTKSSRRLRWILLLTLCTMTDSSYLMVPGLTYGNKNFSGIRRLAGESLSEMMLREKHELPLEQSERELQSIHLALGELISASCADAEDISIRIHAIMIMKNLCTDCKNYSIVVEKFLLSAIPEVVQESFIHWGSKTAERQEQATDEEKGNVSQDNQDGCIDDAERLWIALAPLCLFGYNMNSNSTIRSKFNDIATKTCGEQGKSFEDFCRFLRRSV